METFEQRLQRFQSNSPVEFIETILNSIANGFIQEIELAAQRHHYNLMILGMMAVIETVSEKIFLKSGVKGCKYYLNHFVDGKTDDLKFSKIVNDINTSRNIIAHQWLSKHGHTFGYDHTMELGYIANEGVIVVNPEKLFEQFKSSFQATPTKTSFTVWQYDELMSEEKMQRAKEKFIIQFQER